MADTEPNPNPNSTQYWCYHCNQWVSVSIQPHLPDVICLDCNNGFVESISASPLHPPPLDDSLLGHQFLNVLRLISEAARESDAPPPPPHLARGGNAPPPPPGSTPPPPPPDSEPAHVARVGDAPPPPANSEPARVGDALAPPSNPADLIDGDFLGFELQGWGNDDDDDDDDVVDDDDDDDDENYIYNNEDVDEDNQGNENQELGLERDFDDDDDDDVEGDENNSLEEDERRSRRVVEALRRTLIGDHSGGRLHEALRRNRIIDWAEILMGLEDHSIELRLQVPETGYIGNPGDYVDAAGYEALLQNLAESDNGGRRGAPPASKLAVEGLEMRVVGSKDEVVSCSVCKELVDVGEEAKRLPCGHLYHGDCIVHWLGVRNSCPICRFELPTDDPEYEEERKRKVNHGKTSSSSGVGVEVGVDGGDDGVHPPTG